MKATPVDSATGTPLVALVRRDPTYDRAIILYCSRRPTDDELRAIHDALRNAEIGEPNSSAAVKE